LFCEKRRERREERGEGEKVLKYRIGVANLDVPTKYCTPDTKISGENEKNIFFFWKILTLFISYFLYFCNL